MSKSLPIMAAILIILSMGGCRNKKELVLHKPGETKVWERMGTGSRDRYAETRPRVKFETTMGTFTVELFEGEAPISVRNFLEYVNSGFYAGTIFHRVEPGLVVQGGGFTEDFTPKETRDPIKNEAGNGLRNMRGTLGVARTSEMDSGTSQFYVNVVDNPGFNGNGVDSGYAVFGRVYDGMDVVDSIALVETGEEGPMRNVPVEPVVILSAVQVQ